MQWERGRKAFPHPARLKQTVLPWPRAETSPEKHQCLCKPWGVWGLLGYFPKIHRAAPCWRQHHPWPGVSGVSGWKFYSWQPGMCKIFGFHLPSHSLPQTQPQGVSSPSPNGKVFQPQDLLWERDSPIGLLRGLSAWGFFPFKLFQREVFNYSTCPSLLLLLCKCWMGLELPGGNPSSKRREEEGRKAIHYLQLILFIRYKGAAGSQADMWVNMFKGAAII